MRILLLKSAVIALMTLAVLWNLGVLFYPSDDVYWEVEARGMCDAWSDLLPAIADWQQFPPAGPDAPESLSVDCGEGLRVRSGAVQFEAISAPDGLDLLLGSAEPDWAEEADAEQKYWWSAVLISLVSASILVFPLIRRTRQLEAIAGAVAGGDLDARVAPGGPAELDSLAGSINTMADHLTGHIRARQVMLRAVAHEMGQPLTRARFALELLRDADGPEAEERQLERIERSLDRLEALSLGVGQQLRQEMVDNPSRVTPVALAPLVLAVAEDLDAGDIQLRVVPTPSQVAADPELLRIAVRNLLENALRHASAQVVVVTADGQVIVDDDGAGLPEADRPRALTPFMQGGGGGAMGLGLPIVADIARACGGRLEITDAPLGGARFVLRLPGVEPI